MTEAQENKAEQVKLIDRFAAVYTPIVFVVAVLVAAIPVLVFRQPSGTQAQLTAGCTVPFLINGRLPLRAGDQHRSR